MSTQQQHGIVTPHDHDVLSGRGNFVNYHTGNEFFRNLVRKHKVAYVACPKPQKGKFSKMIYDEIRSRNPPGRFLKQDNSTKLWYDIGEKKALDKTRQALREGAPDIMKELGADDSGDEGDETNTQQQQVSPQAESRLNHNVGLNNYADGVGRFQVEPSPIQTMPASMSAQPNVPQHQFVGNDRVIRMTPDHVVRTPEMLTSSGASVGRFYSLHHPGMTVAPEMLLQDSLIQQHQLQMSPQRGIGRNSSMPLPSIYMVDRPRMPGGTSTMGMGSHVNPIHGHRLNDLDSQQSKITLSQAQMYPDQYTARPLIMNHSKTDEKHKTAYDDAQGTKPDHVAPLPPRRINLKNVRAELKRQGSDGSLQIDNVFGGAGTKMGMNTSSNHLSVMSLSVSDMNLAYPVPALHREEQHDPDTLGPLFHSSMKLSKGSLGSRLSASSTRRTNFYHESLSSGSDLRSTTSDIRQASLSISSEITPHVMDMSVATLGDRFSDFGESSRMTDMSFTNVFEDVDGKD